MRIALVKNVFHTIKTTIDYPPKSPWNKFSYKNFCNLAQIKEKLTKTPLTYNLSNPSATLN